MLNIRFDDKALCLFSFSSGYRHKNRYAKYENKRKLLKEKRESVDLREIEEKGKEQ